MVLAVGGQSHRRVPLAILAQDDIDRRSLGLDDDVTVAVSLPDAVDRGLLAGDTDEGRLGADAGGVGLATAVGAGVGLAHGERGSKHQRDDGDHDDAETADAGMLLVGPLAGLVEEREHVTHLSVDGVHD